jgi:hypothetical protein
MEQGVAGLKPSAKIQVCPITGVFFSFFKFVAYDDVPIMRSALIISIIQSNGYSC